MGDRANIYITQENGEKPGLYFYTHSSGYRLPLTLQDALKRGQDRWEDEQYLSRIIFCELVKGHEMNTTGFGITTYLCDGGYKILTVNSVTQKVGISKNAESTKPVREWTFAEYISIDLGDTGWDALKDGKE